MTSTLLKSRPGGAARAILTDGPPPGSAVRPLRPAADEADEGEDSGSFANLSGVSMIAPPERSGVEGAAGARKDSMGEKWPALVKKELRQGSHELAHEHFWQSVCTVPVPVAF
jgi:hypothetical protein